MTEPDLSVIIVSYRTPAQVMDCLRSLLNEGGLAGLRDPEVILVDNASGDDTPALVRAQFPQVRLIENQTNEGFARANNRGIAQARGRNVLLLNPDTRVPVGALGACAGWLDAQPARVGAMTCRVLGTDGRLQPTCARRLPSLWGEACRAFLLDRLFPRASLFHPDFVLVNETEARAVPCVSGAFMLLRRTALDAAGGGLDPQFFLMYEDTDLCRRLGAAGYEIWYWPGAHITHLGGESWKQERVSVFANAQISALAYFAKHHPRQVGALRLVLRGGVEGALLLLRLGALRHSNDSDAARRLAQARAARQTLQTGKLLEAAPATAAPAQARPT